MRKIIKFGVIIFVFLLLSCQQNQQIAKVETPDKTTQTEKLPKFSVENFSPEQKEKLNKFFSPQTREIFENAEKIVLNTTYEKQSGEKLWNEVKKRTILSEQSEKAEVLNFLYQNSRQSDEKILCKTDDMFSLEAEFEGKKAVIEFDTFCGYLISDGRGFINGLEFEKIITKYVEKYGVNVQ